VPVTTLAALLPNAADRNADAAGIVDGGRRITWAEANTAAERLAATLVAVGVRQGDTVGVHTRKSAEGFLAMHAVVAAGAVAVPLDPGGSPSYLRSIVARSGCTTVITHEPCRASALSLIESPSPAKTNAIRAVIGIDPPSDADGSNPSNCVIVGPDEVASADPIDRAHISIDPSLPAYLITTSGSTGVPKGICHTHESALAYVAFKRAAYDFTPADRISDLAPNHFDISTLALWVAPAVGSTAIVVPETHQLFPASLSALMADSGMTVWYGVPYSLMQLSSRGALGERDLSALRWVLFGGEVAAPVAFAELMAQLPSARFSNVYGPAEVNACAVHHLDGPPSGSEPIPIGRPVANTTVRLVDPDSWEGGHVNRSADTDPPSIVAPGEQGEIWVSADTMMAGYWRQPATNASVIVDWDGVRWYRTGDLGFERPDGEFVFAGRVDHQVKVRGYRVELESIESVLEDLADVGAAAATVVRGDDGSDVIVAGIVPAPGAPVDEATLDRWAHERLPHYSVPSRFYPVGSTPVTGSGKLDRRAMRSALVEHHHASVERT
jgi:amino acid adenylation domain-containing protein